MHGTGLDGGRAWEGGPRCWTESASTSWRAVLCEQILCNYRVPTETVMADTFAAERLAQSVYLLYSTEGLRVKAKVGVQGLVLEVEWASAQNLCGWRGTHWHLQLASEKFCEATTGSTAGHEEENPLAYRREEATSILYSLLSTNYVPPYRHRPAGKACSTNHRDGGFMPVISQILVLRNTGCGIAVVPLCLPRTAIALHLSGANIMLSFLFISNSHNSLPAEFHVGSAVR